MKKKLLIALLTMVSAGSLAAAACQPTEQHVCGHECPTCHKCLDENCTDDVCSEKCGGHEEVPGEKTLVTRINVNTDDETNDGTVNSPLGVAVTQGGNLEVTYGVQPSNATDKTFTWKVGQVENGAFTETPGSGVTVTDSGSKLTIAASEAAVDVIIEGKANDGSGVSVYLAVTVESYTAVTSVTSTTLRAVENQAYDYELVTALGTNWDIGGGMTERGQGLAAGTISPATEGRNPRNLTYYGNVYNFGIKVLPEDATDTDVTVSYSTNGIVTVDPVSGVLTAVKAGETVVTVASYADPTVSMKVKITVQESLYRGILLSEYESTAVSQNIANGWNLDPDDAVKGTEAHYALYSDWHPVMTHCNKATGDDNNQKIFYMGNPNKPYGICLENNVGQESGGSLENSAAMMWAKVTVPQSALTFNVKLSNNDKTHGQYRVVFVDGEGNVTTLTTGESGWVGFAEKLKESTIKLDIPDSIKGVTGAIVVEHRVTQYDNNAELQIKVLKFEGQVDVERVEFATPSALYRTGAREFNITASVKPDNATNDKVSYAMKEGSAAGVTVDANGKVTVEATAAAGVYEIIATSVADNTKTATFTLTLTAEEVEVNEWNNKTELLEGVGDVRWVIVNGFNEGAGEGIDLSTKLNGERDYSAAKLENRKVKTTSFIMTMGIRTFPNEKTTEIVCKVITADGTEVIVPTISGEKAIADNNPEHDGKIDFYSYDLSQFIGQTVTIELGVTGECYHAVITQVKFSGDDNLYTEWANKGEILDADHDGWTIVGSTDAGVGEGADIKGTGTYLSNSLVIGKDYNAKLTYGVRVFHRDGETYPDIKLVVVDKSVEDDEGTVVRAIGADADTVHCDTDEVQYFSYDLSEFAGKEVEVRIQLDNNATHCVIANIKVESAAEEQA